MRDEVVLMITAPEDVGPVLARALVEQRLVACVNQMPGVQSVYRWKDAIEEEREVMLLCKTIASRVGDIDAALKELHPYELFELVALPVAGGDEAYLAWVRDCVS